MPQQIALNAMQELKATMARLENSLKNGNVPGHQVTVCVTTANRRLSRMLERANETPQPEPQPAPMPDFAAMASHEPDHSDLWAV